MPFLLEGALQGLFGAGFGLVALAILFNWIRLQFAGPAAITGMPFAFFPWTIILGIIVAATLLCALGSFSTTRKINQI